MSWLGLDPGHVDVMQRADTAGKPRFPHDEGNSPWGHYTIAKDCIDVMVQQSRSDANTDPCTTHQVRTLMLKE